MVSASFRDFWRVFALFLKEFDDLTKCSLIYSFNRDDDVDADGSTSSSKAPSNMSLIQMDFTSV